MAIELPLSDNSKKISKPRAVKTELFNSYLECEKCSEKKKMNVVELQLFQMFGRSDTPREQWMDYSYRVRLGNQFIHFFWE